MSPRRTAAALALCAAATAAPTCETTLPERSADVATRDAELHLTVEGDAASTTWRAIVIGPAGRVRFEGGDRLLVDGAAMREEGEGAFAVVRPPADAGDVRWSRGDEAEDARVRVPLPPLPRVEVPPEATRAEAIAIAWDRATEAPPGEVLAIRVGGACIDTVEDVIDPFEARFVLPEGALGGEGGCEVVVRVARRRLQDLHAPPLARVPVRVDRAGEARFQLLP